MRTSYRSRRRPKMFAGTNGRVSGIENAPTFESVAPTDDAGARYSRCLVIFWRC